VKNYEEMVREAEAVKDTEKEIEGLIPVRARLAKPVRHVFSLRMSAQEITEIFEAAKQRGMTMSDFMRQASLAAVHGERSLEAGQQATALHAVREKARELYEAVEKLDSKEPKLPRSARQR
jgi:uncharacterized protein (DUF1778 family)